jgi:hypothetical protein
MCAKSKALSFVSLAAMLTALLIFTTRSEAEKIGSTDCSVQLKNCADRCDQGKDTVSNEAYTWCIKGCQSAYADCLVPSGKKNTLPKLQQETDKPWKKVVPKDVHPLQPD